MKQIITVSLILLVSSVLIGWLGATPAAAQCNGSMMGSCSGSENCHESGQQCGEENCPSGMMGSCMQDTSCTGGMMGGCHEGGGGGTPCPMAECPMENCTMPEMCEMMGMMGGCNEMMENCCEGGSAAAHRRIHMRSSPNPFNPTTSLSFSLSEAANVDLRIYDTRGREIEQLATGMMDKGNHAVTFSATNLPAGIYLARLSTPGSVTVQKLVLLK